MNFSETILVYGIIVGRCSQLNEYMKLYEYKRPKSFNDLCPRSLRLETARPIEAKFHVEPPWDEEMKVSTKALCHMTKVAFMPIYDKNL